jgi:hypothetical protein
MIWFDKVKEHVGRHKVAYSVGTVVVIAGVAYYFGVRNGSSKVVSNSIIGNNNKLDQSVTHLVERSGPPSWVIGKIGTDEDWLSQGKAALAEGIRESDLRAQLNGKLDNVNGERYFRKGLAAA